MSGISVAGAAADVVRRRRSPPAHRVAPPLVMVGVVTALGWVCLAWWQDSPEVTGAGGELTAAGRLAGLYAGLLSGLAVLLLARVPWLDRAVGTDRLSRWHATCGRAMLVATTLHVLLMVEGCATIAGIGPWAQLRVFWGVYAHLVAATVAFVLFLVVGLSSARRSRSKLPYEFWQVVHLATYLAIGLMFLHTLADGGDFIEHPVNRFLWKAWFAIAAATLVLFRVLRPAVRALRHRTVVAALTRESSDVVSIEFTGSRMDRFGGRPGQFVRVRFLTLGRFWQSHPYSLSRDPAAGVRITVKAVGRHTRALRRVRPGTRVVLSGPYGGLLAARRTRPGVALIAAGVGITPIRALFGTLPRTPAGTVLLYRAATDSDLVLGRELDEIAERTGDSVHHLTGPRPADPNLDPLAVAGLSALVPDIAERDVYLCGPPGMILAVSATLRSLGVPRHAIHTERFAL